MMVWAHRTRIASVLAMCLLVVGITFTIAAQHTKDLIEEGKHLHDEGQYEQAIVKFKEALSLAPSSTAVLYELGQPTAGGDRCRGLGRAIGRRT